MFPYQLKSLEQYHHAYHQSIENPTQFWADIAQHFSWQKKWDKVLEADFDKAEIKWFAGAKLNITENCLDRHIEKLASQPAIIWEPNDPTEHHRVLTYKELLFKVKQFANVLKNNGVKKGDRVCIYMGMIPELAIAV